MFRIETRAWWCRMRSDLCLGLTVKIQRLRLNHHEGPRHPSAEVLPSSAPPTVLAKYLASSRFTRRTPALYLEGKHKPLCPPPKKKGRKNSHLAQCSGRKKLAVVRATLALPVRAHVAAAGRPPPRRAPRAPGVGNQLALGGDAARAVVVAVLAGLQDPVATGRLVRLGSRTRTPMGPSGNQRKHWTPSARLEQSGFRGVNTGGLESTTLALLHSARADSTHGPCQPTRTRDQPKSFFRCRRQSNGTHEAISAGRA